MPSLSRQRPYRLFPLLSAAVCCFLLFRSAGRPEVLFTEGFDGLLDTLQPAQAESIPAATLGWTHTPPAGWSIDNSEMGTGGMPEWRGWSFATPAFWTAADMQEREAFSLGSGVLAIADADEWMDQAASGQFNSVLVSPPIAVPADRVLYLSFDSHFRPYADMTAEVFIAFDGGPRQRILLYDAQAGSANKGADRLNESLQFTLAPRPEPAELTLSFSLTQGGNDWFWAIDNLVLTDAPPSNLSLLAPNGDESWEAGTLQEIRWAVDDPTGSVLVELMRGESLVSTLATLPLAERAFDWQLSPYLADSDQYRIRLRTTAQPVLEDLSDGAFTVFGARPEPVQTGGPRGDGSYIVPTRQVIQPAGSSITFGGRPVDLAVHPNGRILYLKDDRGVVVVDSDAGSVLQELPTAGTSMHGILLTHDAKALLVSDAAQGVHEFTVGADGLLTKAREITLAAGAYPCGLAQSPDGGRLYVCASKRNALVVIVYGTGRVLGEIPVGIAPYDVEIAPDGATAYVSNWGGRQAEPGEKTADSAGTAVPVDERGVAVSGTVSIVDLAMRKELVQLETGLHAADLVQTADGRLVFVANANADTVSVIAASARKVVHTFLVRPEADMPYGSASNALALGPEERRLYVANGGNNAVAVLDVAWLTHRNEPNNWSGWMVFGIDENESPLKGLIPTGWYPGAVAVHEQSLFVANVKGKGSRGGAGNQVKAFTGSVNKIALPQDSELAAMTSRVEEQSLLPDVLRAFLPPRPDVPPRPVPERVGEPSVFKHVVYVIKENRTYDQVFGDLPQGNGDPSLTTLGREVSPNHHALAEEFVLLDNYYCNGVNSADGHSWATEGNSTDHLEKAFGGFSRSYTFGDDPLTYSSTGFVWDNVMAHGKTFRNYGEFDYATPVPFTDNWLDIYNDFIDNGRLDTYRFQKSIGVERVLEHTDPDYPGWNMKIPDIVRADIFIRRLQEHDADPESEWYNFMLVYLPEDHGGGGPTLRAHMADNDLALGRVVDAISRSRFWNETVIFVNEDDPQAGLDHVDGHRSLCLVVSPYTKRGAVISEFYSQTSVLHTMQQILGCPPMNQMDAMATLMTECFNDTPDVTPYTVRPATWDLTEGVSTVQADMDPRERAWAERIAKINLTRPGMKTPDDDDALNRYFWHQAMGWDTPYPEEWAGHHGRGLGELGLLWEEGEED